MWQEAENTELRENLSTARAEIRRLQGLLSKQAKPPPKTNKKQNDLLSKAQTEVLVLATENRVLKEQLALAQKRPAPITPTPEYVPTPTPTGCDPLQLATLLKTDYDGIAKVIEATHHPLRGHAVPVVAPASVEIKPPSESMYTLAEMTAFMNLAKNMMNP